MFGLDTLVLFVHLFEEAPLLSFSYRFVQIVPKVYLFQCYIGGVVSLECFYH